MTPTSDTLHCFFYRSHIAPDHDIRCVADIVKTARCFNKTQGITGILIFDGQQFCQYVEGPQPALQTLVARIVRDSRNQQFTVLHQADGLSQRRFNNWAMAYVLVDDDEPLEALTALQGQHALDKLQALIPQLDIG